jgi:cob(I)alamin adenosyltransferase
LFEIQTALFEIQTTLFEIQTALIEVQTTLFEIQTTLFEVQTALFEIQTALFTLLKMAWISRHARGALFRSRSPSCPAPGCRPACLPCSRVLLLSR